MIFAFGNVNLVQFVEYLLQFDERPVEDDRAKRID